MKQRMIGFLSVMLLTAASHLCYGQYFQRLFDVDSSQEWGWSIFVKPDSSYFIFGTEINTAGADRWNLFNIQISPDGNTVIGKNILKIGDANLYLGIPGQVNALPWGGYVAPYSEQISYDTTYRAWSGLIKYNAVGDTLFLKIYTDTSLYYDAISACAIMPDGGYILGGGASLKQFSFISRLHNSYR